MNENVSGYFFLNTVYIVTETFSSRTTAHSLVQSSLNR